MLVTLEEATKILFSEYKPVTLTQAINAMYWITAGKNGRVNDSQNPPPSTEKSIGELTLQEIDVMCTKRATCTGCIFESVKSNCPSTGLIELLSGVQKL